MVFTDLEVDMLTVTRVKNPLDRTARDVSQYNYTTGAVLADVLTDVEKSIAVEGELVSFAVSVNGMPVGKDQYENHKLLPGQYITIIPIIHVGGGAKNVLRMVAMIALAVAVNYFAPGFGAAIAPYIGVSAATATIIVGSAMLIAGSMLINAILPPDIPQIQTIESSNTYSWNPQTMQRQGIPMPRHYGICKATGNIIGVYRESYSNDQYLNLLISLGDGVLSDIYDLRLNDQPIENFTGVTIESRLGYSSQTTMNNFGDTVTEYALQTEIKSSASYTYTTIGDEYNAIEVEVGFPNGLYHANDSGGLDGYSVEFKIEYRKNGTYGDWIPLTKSPNNSLNIDSETYGTWMAGYYVPKYADGGAKVFYVVASGGDHYYGEQYDSKSTWVQLALGQEYTTSLKGSVVASYNKNQAIRYPFKTDAIDISRYDIRVTKLTTDSTDVRYGDDLYLTAVREILYDDFQYPGEALVGIRALASSSLSGSFSFSCRTHGRYVRVYDGYNWTVEPSSNPAWICFDILTQPIFDNNLNVTEYQAHDPAYFDIDRFLEWAEHCDDLVPDGNGGTEPRITYNGSFDSTQTMWDAAISVAKIGRATPYWRGNTITVAVDKASVPVALISVGNIGIDSFDEVFLDMSSRANTIEADFLNFDKDLERDKLTVINMESPSEWGTASLPLQGVIKPSEAYRHCMYNLATTQLLERVVNINMDIDSIAFTLGDVINVQHDVPMWGEGGRIVSATSDSVTLDKEVTIDSGQTYSVMVRLKDNTVVTRTVNVAPGTYSTLQLVTPFTDIPEEFDIYAFGEQDYVTKPMRVIGIAPQGDLMRKITLTDYNESIYSLDDGIPVIPTINYSRSPIPKIANLTATEYIYYNESASLIREAALTWRVVNTSLLDYSEVYMAIQGLPYQLVGTTKELSFNVAIDPSVTYLFKVVAINKFGTASADAPVVILNSSNTSSAISEIVDVSVSGLEVVGGGTVFYGKDCNLTWNAPTISNSVSYYEVKVYFGASLMRSERIETPYYTYTYGMNFDDFDGIPQSEFTVTITAVDIGGTATTPASISVSNADPFDLELFTGVGELMSNKLIFEYQSMEDFDYIEIYTNTVNDFNTATLLGQTEDAVFYHTGLPAASSRYYWARIKDLYGNYSSWTNGLNIVSLADPTDMLYLLDANITEDSLIKYLSGKTSLIDVFDTTNMVFENGVVGPGVIARYIEAIGQNCSDLVVAKNEITSLLATVSDLIVGEWNDYTSYSIGQFVTYQDNIYRAIAPSINIIPTDENYWELSSGIVTLISQIEQQLDVAIAQWTSEASEINLRIDGDEITLQQHTTTIQQNTTDISLRATKTELAITDGNVSNLQDGLEILDGTVSQVVIDLNAAEQSIALKADQVDFDALAETVANQEAIIEVSANFINIATNAVVGTRAFVLGQVVADGVQVETLEDIYGTDLMVSQNHINLDTANANISIASSRLDAAEGRLTNAEIDIDGAEASISLLASELDLVTGRVDQAEIDIDGAEASITLLGQSLDETNGRLTQAEIDIDGANAAILLRATKVELDDLGDVVSEQGSSLELLADRATLKLTNNDNVAGMVIGWEGETSEIGFLANKFKIVNPSLETDKQQVFTVGDIGGVGTVGIDGNIIIDGSVLARSIATEELIVGDNIAMGANAYIEWSNVNNSPDIPNGTYIDAEGIYTGILTAEQVNTSGFTAQEANIANAAISTAKIGNAQVDTLQIKDNAVTIPVSSFSYGPIAIDSIYTYIQSVNIDSGGNPVIILINGYAKSTSTLSSNLDLSLRCNGIEIFNYQRTAETLINYYALNSTISATFVHSPQEGINVYSLYSKRSSYLGINIHDISILCLGVKR